MDLTILFIIGAALVAIVTAVVEVAKKTFKIKARYLPITSVVIGIFVAILVWPLTEYSLYVMIVAGIIGGLTASGSFDLAKAMKKGDK